MKTPSKWCIITALMPLEIPIQNVLEVNKKFKHVFLSYPTPYADQCVCTR
jgi:hypothetical protein